MSRVLRPEGPDILRETRERAGMSRRDLEKATIKAGGKVSEATIFNIETRNFKRGPYPQSVYALCEVLEIDPDQVFVVNEKAIA